MSKYKIGDIVELNSGGPPMTVTGFRDNNPLNQNEAQWDYAYPECTWFDLNLCKQSAYFPEDALQVCDLDDINIDDDELDDYLGDNSFSVN